MTRQSQPSNPGITHLLSKQKCDPYLGAAHLLRSIYCVDSYTSDIRENNSQKQLPSRRHYVYQYSIIVNHFIIHKPTMSTYTHNTGLLFFFF